MKTKRPITLVGLLLAWTCMACAQKVAGRVVIAESGKALARATCKVVTPTDSLLAYRITGSDGVFSLTLPDRADAVVFSCIGYESRRIDKARLTDHMEVAMERSTHSIADVIVKAPAMVRRKDTIDYNVSSFIGKDDKHLEDILKKLPGIEVAENGSISYQGKPISSFQIEGRNLLGGRYNQATRNMPVEAVAKVQVMENDQNVRALKDKVFSEKTSLNIKLKKDYKARPFGEVTLSAGGFNPFVWDGRMTLLNIAAQNQTLVTAESNSTGNSLTGMALDHIDVASMETYHLVPRGLLDDITLRLLSMKRTRYTDNRSYSVGANHLFGLSRYSSLVFNLAYVREKEHAADSTFQELGGLSTFRLTETNRLVKRHHAMQPSLSYELNAAKVYVKDELKASFAKTDIGNRLTSNDVPADNALTKRPAYVQNLLKMVINDGTQVYSLRSLLRYFSGNEDLTAPLVQHLHHHQLLTENSLSTSFLIGRQVLGLEYANEYLRNNHLLEDADAVSSVFIHRLKTEWQAHTGKWRFNVTLPLEVTSVRVPRKDVPSATRWRLSPALSCTYSPNALFNLQVFGSHRESTDEEPMLLQPYYSNYRTRNVSPDFMGWTKRDNMGFSMSYQSILHLLSWYLYADVSWNKSDHYFTYDYLPEATFRTPVRKDNRQQIIFLTTSLRKVFGKGVSLKTSLSYNNMEMLLSQNGTTDNYHSNAVSVSADFSCSALSWLSFSCSTTGNMGWYDGIPESRLKNLHNDIRLTLYPVRHLSVMGAVEHHLNEIARGSYRQETYVDATVEYTPTRSLSLYVKATNLLDRRSYVSTSVSALQYSYFSKPLRGREVIAGITFKF